MGMPVTLNRRVVPAVRCAEREIRATCKGVYRPQYLSGFRAGNTYHGGEVSNHLYGIALDVDPERNVCCKCLGPAAMHPVCATRRDEGQRADEKGLGFGGEPTW